MICWWCFFVFLSDCVFGLTVINILYMNFIQTETNNLHFRHRLTDESPRGTGGAKTIMDFSPYDSHFEEYLAQNLRKIFGFNVKFTQTEHNGWTLI
jgi:hypothetical protein